MADLDIILFPCLADNYGILLHDPASGRTASIDAPDAEEISRQCERRGWVLTEIWNTHHHFDHVGGNLALKERYDLRVFGPDQIQGRIPALDEGLSEGSTFDFGGHEVQVFETPGHTRDHIVYYVADAQAGFVGDVIFALGCGRLFEGTAEQMWESLSKIMEWPDETRLYCAHEYTLSNARFALSIDPDNQALNDAVKQAQAKRDKGDPTVPTTVGLERRSNPFVLAGSAAELGRRRALKDAF